MPIDYSTYSPDWKTKIRPAIITRAFDHCEFCNVKNKALIVRGERNGKDIYQDTSGYIYDAKTSEYLGGDYLGTVGNGLFIKVVLTVAHLDHDINNNDYANLKALCQRCHLRTDIEHHKETKRAKRALKQPNLF